MTGSPTQDAALAAYTLLACKMLLVNKGLFPIRPKCHVPGLCDRYYFQSTVDSEYIGRRCSNSAFVMTSKGVQELIYFSATERNHDCKQRKLFSELEGSDLSNRVISIWQNFNQGPL